MKSHRISQVYCCKSRIFFILFPICYCRPETELSAIFQFNCNIFIRFHTLKIIISGPKTPALESHGQGFISSGIWNRASRELVEMKRKHFITFHISFQVATGGYWCSNGVMNMERSGTFPNADNFRGHRDILNAHRWFLERHHFNVHITNYCIFVKLLTWLICPVILKMQNAMLTQK